MIDGLKGIKVIEATSAVGAPMASRLLADWGADVIKIDQPNDFMHKPRAKYINNRAIQTDINFMLQNVSRNKRGIAINFAEEAGQEIIHKLIKDADVFIANLLPRQLEKFKIDYATLSKLNPRLIFGHFTGFGGKGPDRNKPAYGTVADARSGLLHVLQSPGVAPVQMPLAHADFTTGVTLAYGIMTALFIRERTGMGQAVETSLYQSGVWTLSGDVAAALITGKDRQAVARKDILTPTMTSYETKDGRWLCLMVVPQTERYWPIFCKVIEREDLLTDSRFDSPEGRAKNYRDLFNILNETFLTKTLEEWKTRLNEGQLPWGPVQNLPEITQDPQARANDFFIPLDHPKYGKIEVVANPVSLSKTKAEMRPAPEYGQHTDEVLQELGYTVEDIVKFREQKVIL